jgi:hypothetical protein
MMEKMLEIPPDLDRVDAFKTCLILGLTVMLYILIARDFGAVADVVTTQSVLR